MNVVIEPLPDGAWQELRDLRLQALKDAPDAFWATWQDESMYGAREWTRFTRSVAWFLAARDGRSIGLVGAVQRDDCSEEREVIGMWVHPAERGQGVAGLLLDTVSGWAIAQGAAALTLWVTQGNDDAHGLYRRHGFTLTGEDAPMPGGRAGREVRMRRPLSQAPPVRPHPGSLDPESLAGVPPHLQDLAASALARARNDPRVVALVVGGSVARGAADEYSDLDLVVVCDDETQPDMLASAKDFAASLGPLLVAFTGEHVAEPRLLIALYDPGPRHVDLKFVRVRDLASRVEDGLVVWQRGHVVDRAYERRQALWPTADPQWIEDRFWVWLHYATAKVARGEFFEAVDALSFMRTTTLAPLITTGRVPNPNGVRRIEQIAPTLMPALRTTICDATAADCLRVAEAIVALYVSLRDLKRIEQRVAAERSTREYLSSVAAQTRAEPDLTTKETTKYNPCAQLLREHRAAIR